MASSAGLEQLRSDEGTRTKAYMIDGVLHIGIGFNLERGDGREQLILAGVKPDEVDAIMKEGGAALTDDQVESLFQNSLLQAESSAQSFAGGAWEKLPQGMRDVIVNMSFQLGPKGLRGFTEMKAALDKHNWEGVKREMADSEWASKEGTPKRAKRLIGKVGELPPTAQAELPELKVDPKKAMIEGQKQATADRLGSMLSKTQMIDRMGKALADAQTKEAEQQQVESNDNST